MAELKEIITHPTLPNRFMVGVMGERVVVTMLGVALKADDAANLIAWLELLGPSVGLTRELVEDHKRRALDDGDRG